MSEAFREPPAAVQKPLLVRLALICARWTLREKRHAVIVICGETGEGKSSLAHILVDIIHRIMKRTWRPEDVFFWDDQDAENRHHDSPPGTVIVYDEAIRGGNKRRGMSAQNVQRMERLNTNRYRGHIHILLLPFLEDQDKAQLRHADFLLEVPSRGRFKLWRKKLMGPAWKKWLHWAHFQRDGMDLEGGKFPNPEETHPAQVARIQELKREFLDRGEGRVTGAMLLEEVQRTRRIVRHFLRPLP